MSDEEGGTLCDRCTDVATEQVACYLGCSHEQCLTCATQTAAEATEWCHLPAPTARDGGALCARSRGHASPGWCCTSNVEKADRLDAATARDHES